MQTCQGPGRKQTSRIKTTLTVFIEMIRFPCTSLSKEARCVTEPFVKIFVEELKRLARFDIYR